ncbi:MAG TPA: DPP IV N-terminal domain-containing protein, partial [Armatimonadota bacterium]|nr:DPP IV N-terminal domain-containing protein [Armatimonadota bacterium]
MRPSLERLFAQPPITGPDLAGIAWHPEGRCLTYLEREAPDEDAARDLWAFDLGTGERTCLLRGRDLHPPDRPEERLSLSGYQWLPDGALLLLHRSAAWRCSPAGDPAECLVESLDERVAPRIDPTGRRLAFIREGNLWVRDLAAGEERPLTGDGGEAVLNGVLDWVYWEELANRRNWRAFEWSPDGSALALLRLDCSGVPEYPLASWLEAHPEVRPQRYPNAGDPNPVPSVLIVSAEDGRVLNAARHEDDACYAGPDLAWAPDGSGVAWARMPRDQKSLALLLLPA